MAVQGGSGGGGKGAGDVRAGGAFFEVYAKDGLSGVLDKLKAKVQAFSGFMKRIGGNLFGAGAALGGGPLALLFGATDRAAAVEDLTDIFGLTAEAASKMAYAFNVAGVSMEDLEGVFKQLAKSNTGGKPLNEHLLDVADALLAIEDPSERVIKAQELLTRKGVDFLRVAGDLNKLYAEATPLTMEQVKAAEALKQQWAKTTIVLQMAMVPFLEFLAPVAKMLGDFVRENAQVVAIVAVVATVLATAGVAFFVFGSAIGAATSVVTTLVAIVGALLTPIGLVATALVGLTATVLAVTVDWQEMGDIFSETWTGIASAIKSGNMELALEIASAGLLAVWQQLMLDLRKGWNDFSKWLVDWMKRNPWILPAIGAAVGFAMGGPAGALAGAAAGGVGALGIDQFAEEIKDALNVDTGPAEDRLKAARERLRDLVEQANQKQGIEEQKRQRQQLNQMIIGAEAVRGGFGAGRNSMQQFGYGNDIKSQTDLLKQINEGSGKLPGAIGKAVADEMKMK